ncbi:MAG: hypothetical protein ACYCOU_06325 [Sulfobacillus sp.]
MRGGGVKLKSCDSKKSWDCVVFPEGYAAVTLPAGTIIYRITPLKNREYGFFTGKKIAEQYSDTGEIIAYRVVHPLRLLDASNFRNVRKLLDAADTQKERDLVRIYFSYGIEHYQEKEERVVFDDRRELTLKDLGCDLPDADFPGYICTKGFYDADDHKNDFYVARAMLRLVCQKTGLDGWIHFGIWPVASTKMGAEAFSFQDEIAICRPAEVVEKL